MLSGPRLPFGIPSGLIDPGTSMSRTGPSSHPCGAWQQPVNSLARRIEVESGLACDHLESPLTIVPRFPARG
ncbi:hypothetical protein APS60_06920 [Cutibacterium acnes]|uniref:Uncharacterized protein n=1 Tax=Cutibacterium acnes TaxID=1747 RepID=A0AA44U5P8_CUTAC|nr:hypothetical protein APS59_07470 [Cutibacterium acnes]PGF24877.1 hypothetical protein B1B02_11520 [Cutibacterium acnes subsp. defendens]PGF24993.1 hypothetical protein B1B08_11325 [Cutibacterium acnes subsp. defendens]PGF39507.1 hypothetical protein B1B14_05495 [Cutibacterium acnes subsp. defendens]PGF44965.1 hypothetical protein B1B12_09210 [Cutibacterium acnes subsp. defendens]